MPEHANKALVETMAAEAKKLAQSVVAEPRSVVESDSELSTATAISSGTVANTEGTSVEMLKQGKHMMCRHVILLR